MAAHDGEFTQYYVARAPAMRSTAYLLCGDWHTAEDLVQTAFTKLYLAWNRLSGHDRIDGYVRQTLVRAFIDLRRRPWRRELPSADGYRERSGGPAGGGDPARHDAATEERLVLLRALAAVPPRQRAVLVLRYWEDLSEAATAAILGCSLGTVKSQAARGLANLREQLSHVEGVR
jgi:RNA polymerase sigma-70 factor (sigma-E family)